MIIVPQLEDVGQVRSGHPTNFRASVMRVVAALTLLLTLAATLTARVEAASPSSSPLCDSLSVPEGYVLTCETRIEAGQRSERAVVRPSSGGPVPALARLTLRPLSREEAPLAWTDPARWLADQVVIDVSGVSGFLEGLGSSDVGPLAHPAAKATVDGLVTTLAGWSRLALEACTPAEGRPGRHELSCHWGVAPLALDMNLRLVEAGDRRYSISYWAADETRLRHLEAIANSFAPPG
jgi:hypothetical protein